MCEPYLEHLQEQFLQANKSVRSARLRIVEALSELQDILANKSVSDDEREELRSNWVHRRQQLMESDLYASRKLARFANSLFEELDSASAAVREWNGKTPSELKDVYQDRLSAIGSSKSSLASEIGSLVQHTAALLMKIAAIDEAESILKEATSLSTVPTGRQNDLLDQFFDQSHDLRAEIEQELDERLSGF